MEKIWRLILDGPQDPHLNMAIDEAIMLSQAQESAAPTLRIYRWLYPSISVGRFQDSGSPIIFDDDLPVVKRPTGGGAVLHNELSFTYSMIYREDSGVVPKGVLNSYREIHLGIRQGLKELGIETEVYVASKKAIKNNCNKSCFASPVEFDLMYGGNKIAGAAQRRKFGVVLHQGEVGLSLDVWEKRSYNTILAAFLNGLSKYLGARFAAAPISDKERSLAEELLISIGEVKR